MITLTCRKTDRSVARKKYRDINNKQSNPVYIDYIVVVKSLATCPGSTLPSPSQLGSTPNICKLADFKVNLDE